MFRAVPRPWCASRFAIPVSSAGAHSAAAGGKDGPDAWLAVPTHLMVQAAKSESEIEKELTQLGFYHEGSHDVDGVALHTKLCKVVGAAGRAPSVVPVVGVHQPSNCCPMRSHPGSFPIASLPLSRIPTERGCGLPAAVPAQVGRFSVRVRAAVRLRPRGSTLLLCWRANPGSAHK